MNRRGFFGGLVASVLSLLGFGGTAKAFRSQTSGGWPVDYWAIARREWDKAALFPRGTAPNPLETEEGFLQWIVKDLVEFGQCLLWTVRDTSGQVTEVHRILSARWMVDKRCLMIPVNDLPTTVQGGSRELANTFIAIPEKDVVWLRITPEEFALAERFLENRPADRFHQYERHLSDGRLCLRLSTVCPRTTIEA